MRNLLLATAAVPFVSLAAPALPASADTVVRRETTIITRTVEPRVVQRRHYRAPTTAYYYSAPRRAYAAPRRYTYASDGYYYTAPRSYSAPGYTYTSTYYSAPAYGYSDFGYDEPGYTYTAIGDSCDWLHRRAVNTGSPYWWNRYEDCRD